MAATLLQQNDLSNGTNSSARIVAERTEAALRNYAVYISNNGSATQPQQTWAALVLTGTNARTEAVKALPFMQGDPARDLAEQMDAMSDANIKILAESAANAHLI